MAIKGTDYEVALLSATKEILLRFIEVNTTHFVSAGVVKTEIIGAATKAIADALHAAVKQK